MRLGCRGQNLYSQLYRVAHLTPWWTLELMPAIRPPWAIMTLPTTANNAIQVRADK